MLEGKKALITAASRGLGKAAAIALAREGAQIAICARGEDIHQTVDEIRQSTGGVAMGMQADVTKVSDIQRFVQAALETYGQIDILILNAGGPAPGSFLDLEPHDWEYAVQLTLMSAVHTCYAVIPQMIERGAGSIVASQSVSVKQPIQNLILSNSVRLAVVGMMKSLAAELGPHGIRVNTINPGWTATDRVQQLLSDRATRNQTDIDTEIAKIVQDVPLGRMATVEEYGRAIAWLASPAASYLHGHALYLDGGMVTAPL